jgi:glycosyltransferase involved in cell wall biosynthesis
MNFKIFFIIPFLTKGGAQRVVTNLSNHFISKGYSVFILILNDCEIGYELDKRIQVVHIIKGRNSNLLVRTLNSFKTFSRIYSLVRKESPDCVVSFITSANMWTGLICSILNIPYFVSERTVTSRTLDTYHPLVKKIIQFVYKRSVGIVVPSIGIRAELRDKHKLSNIKVIKNPVTSFAPLTNKNVHSRPFILAVGRLNYVKGFDLLIEAYSMIRSKAVDLIIVGEGKDRARLTDLIHSKGLSGSVFLAGRKANMQDYYDQCDIFVLSSRNEGYPNVLIEAMSAGCASIAFDCQTGPSEIIDNGINGLLIKNGDVRMLADAIDLLISDKELREKIAEQARLVAEANSMQDIANEWENLLVNHKL